MSRIRIDPEKCIGCRICEVMCSLRHERKINPRKARIRVYRVPNQSTPNKIVLCQQCEVPACAKVCAAGAIEKGKGTDIYSISRNKCTRCLACVEACPFEAVFVHPEKSFPVICDLCSGRPECVSSCPTEALELVPRHPVIAR